MKNILLVFVHNNKEFLPKMSFFFLKVIYCNSDKNVNTALRVKPCGGCFPGFGEAWVCPSTPKTKDDRGDDGGRVKLAGLYSPFQKLSQSGLSRKAPCTHEQKTDMCGYEFGPQLWSLLCTDGQLNSRGQLNRGI